MDSSAPQVLTVPQAIDLAAKLFREGQREPAERICRQLISSFPHEPVPWQMLGVAAIERGELETGVRHMEHAIRLDGTRSDFFGNLGEAYRRTGDLVRAQAALEKAIQLEPRSAFAYGNLGIVFRELGEARQAREAFLRSWTLKPQDAMRVKAALVLPIILESTAQLSQERTRLLHDVDQLLADDLQIEAPASRVGMVPFYSAYHGLDDRQLQEQLANLYVRGAPSLNYVAPHCSVVSAGSPTGSSDPGRIRIGFVSTFFFEHTIARLTAGLMANLSRERFEVTMFSVPGVQDGWSHFLRRSADRTIVLPYDLPTARAQIAACELDILFYPDIGMDPKTYFLAFSRLAPVQCVTWGHPVTTGIPTIDYFISSSALEPPDASRHYTEQLVLLDNLPTFYHRPTRGQPCHSRAELGLPSDSHLYVWPHSLFKMHPDFDEVLRNILRHDPAGQVVLVDSWEPHWGVLLNNRLRRTLGDLFDRVTMLPRMPWARFLELLAAADVILDPIYFSGGNTSYEAFSLGTPIVTLPGDMMRSRVTMALYRQMGIEDCIATSLEHYVQLAVRLGTDSAWRAEIRHRLIEHSDRLYENIQAVRELEQFFVQAARPICDRGP